MFSIVLFVAALIATSKGLEISSGNCESMNVNVVQNVDLNKYLGKWYDVRRYDTTFQFGDCATAEYSLYNASTVYVYNSELISNGTQNTVNGSAYPSTTTGEAKFTVIFPSNPVPSPYWVVSSDYTGYAIVWSCTNLANNQKMEFLWILSRNRTLTTAQENVISQALADNGIGRGRFRHTDQSDEFCGDYYNSDTSGSGLLPKLSLSFLIVALLFRLF